MNRVGQRVIADVQNALFTRLMRADLAYFHAHPSGTLISRFTSDAALLRSAAANVLGGIGKDALTVVFLVGVMFYQDWLLALVCVLSSFRWRFTRSSASAAACAGCRPTPRPRSAS